MVKKKNKFGNFKRDLRKEVIDLFERAPETAVNHKQVSAALGIADAGVRTLIYEILQEEASSGTLKETERGRYVLAETPKNLVLGNIEINRYGKGYVTVPGLDVDVEIEKGSTGFALHGDLVEIQLIPRKRRPSGRIIRVVERRKKLYVGTIERYKEHAFFLPSDKKIHVDFFIPKDELNGAIQNDKVAVEMISWDNPEHKPIGKVTQVLGQPGSHLVEMNAIILEFDLPTEFPESVHLEAEAIPAEITKEEIAKRRDMRGIPTFTIDPFDAKDFDDALSYHKLENGNLEVGVHIADVSHYVQPNSLIDKEATLRATSIYLVDRTIPMLPEKLSNFLCSLRPNEDKLCFSAVFEINEHADVVNHWFGRTVIHSDRRFTYEEAQERIEGKGGDFADEILHLDQLAKKLRAKRYAAGSIDFNSEEVKFQLDEKGKPVGVFIKKMKDSNQLIEDFMLLANREVAYFIGHPKNGITLPFVYRIHDEPSPEKIASLKTFLKHLGYKLPKTNPSEEQGVIKSIIQLVDGQPEEGSVRTMAVRSMAKAEYSTQNIGHFGLAFDYYTHFTSPIRRFPDVMVHRLLQHYLDQGNPVNENEYALHCRHSSAMEKRAAEAERASIKYKQVEYMLERKGQIFEATISGLANWGMYAEVNETRCEGLIPLDTMTGDQYTFSPEEYVVRGLKRKYEFRLGDQIKILVVDGNIDQRTLDYILVDK
jgi:ribonuclease R